MVPRIDVPLNDLKRQYEILKPHLEQAVQRVLTSGWYILGPEVDAFENAFANYCNAAHCVGVANGTDALEIALRALGIAQGDEVVTVANAGMYSTTAIRAIGAVPAFAEIDPATLTIDPASLPGVTTARTRAIIATHLYGRMCHMAELTAYARQHALALVEDCAQAHGAQMDGQRAGSWGDAGCFSFYPTKNLGALGDGGALVTSDAQVAQRARQLRQYGWVRKYEAQTVGGRNSRLDEMQAAILRTKLPYLDQWNQARIQVSEQYQAGLRGAPLQLPADSSAVEMIYHLYVIRTTDRDRLRAVLCEQRIGCDIHYPIPDHLQSTCVDLGYARGALPETELAAAQVLTLPCFAELTSAEVSQVISAVRKSLGA